MDVDMDTSGAGPSSSRRSGSNTVYIPETTFHATPQAPFRYHSLDGKDPVICIDNGELTPSDPILDIYGRPSD